MHYRKLELFSKLFTWITSLKENYWKLIGESVSSHVYNLFEDKNLEASFKQNGPTFL